MLGLAVGVAVPLGLGVRLGVGVRVAETVLLKETVATADRVAKALTVSVAVIVGTAAIGVTVGLGLRVGHCTTRVGWAKKGERGSKGLFRPVGLSNQKGIDKAVKSEGKASAKTRPSGKDKKFFAIFKPLSWEKDPFTDEC